MGGQDRRLLVTILLTGRVEGEGGDVVDLLSTPFWFCGWQQVCFYGTSPPPSFWPSEQWGWGFSVSAAALSGVRFGARKSLMLVGGCPGIVGAGICLHATFRSPNLKARLNSYREEFRAVWRGYSDVP